MILFQHFKKDVNDWIHQYNYECHRCVSLINDVNILKMPLKRAAHALGFPERNNSIQM